MSASAPETTTETTPETTPRKGFRLDLKTVGPLVALALLVILGISLNENFLTYNNITNVLARSSFIGIIAIGATFVITSVGLDLSVGSMAAVIAGVMIIVMNALIPSMGIGWGVIVIGMIAGSFLVKNLLLDWREGEKWFWDTLVDADLANNAGGWQWIAGCGADAAPYFRIFNPVSQSLKFDPEGAYIRRYVPELRDFPLEYLHAPWEAPKGLWEKTGYPAPIVDHATTRARALEAVRVRRLRVRAEARRPHHQHGARGLGFERGNAQVSCARKR